MVDGTEADGSIVVRLSGEIDITTAPPIEAFVNGLEADDSICFDVTEVDFMDSLGLRLVAQAYRRAQGAGGHVSVKGASTQLGRLFTLSGLGFLLESA